MISQPNRKTGTAESGLKSQFSRPEQTEQSFLEEPSNHLEPRPFPERLQSVVARSFFKAFEDSPERNQRRLVFR